MPRSIFAGKEILSWIARILPRATHAFPLSRVEYENHGPLD